ncbi:unnamed protein product [Microthlaspi erraticum]|uniref:Uncharacterized protein n=1 Tax=Microthlaspi erraticum TaxID=1685480 RepID=A0A6D2HKZ5_9BRAS|nr:unnamed protein product [Microthlaspi erraticum]
MASEASVDASVGLGAGAAPGWGGAPAQGLDDLVVGLLTQLLARFPPVVPQGAPGVPPVAEVQQRAAGFVQPQAVGLGAVLFGYDGAHAEDWYAVLRAELARGGGVASEIGAEFPVYQIGLVPGGVGSPLSEWRCTFVVAGHRGHNGCCCCVLFIICDRIVEVLNALNV